LREERRLRVFENRVLRTVFDPKRDEVTGNGKNYILRSLVICILTKYCAGCKTGKNEMGGACGAYGGSESCSQGSGGEILGKETLGRRRRRWDDNIKMDLQDVEGACGDWMELAQDSERWRALVSAVMNFRVL
jgi:hypothetical protein